MQLHRSFSFLPLAALLLIMQTFVCHAGDNEDFMDFQVQALGETATLYCNSTESEQAKAIPTLYEPIAWMLPNLSLVDQNDSVKHQLHDNNWTLVIQDTVMEDLGVYHCMLLNTSQNTSGYYLVKVGLNAEGPYFFDMWEKYMWPAIIGICSFFGFLLIACVFIVLYHFRYVSPRTEEDDSDSDESEGEKADVKLHAADLTDDGKSTAHALPLYNGSASHTYENPTFKEDAHPHDASHTYDNSSFKEDHHPHKAESESDDEDLTSL